MLTPLIISYREWNKKLSFMYLWPVNCVLCVQHPQLPVVLTFTGFDRLLGSHFDKYDILYKTFNTSVNTSLFNQDFSSCTSFPGPGVSLPMAENPVFSFVGADGVHSKYQSHKVDSEFENFKEKHGRQYSSNKEEELRKFHFRHNHR